MTRTIKSLMLVAFVAAGAQASPHSLHSEEFRFIAAFPARIDFRTHERPASKIGKFISYDEQKLLVARLITDLDPRLKEEVASGRFPLKNYFVIVLDREHDNPYNVTQRFIKWNDYDCLEFTFNRRLEKSNRIAWHIARVIFIGESYYYLDVWRLYNDAELRNAAETFFGSFVALDEHGNTIPKVPSAASVPPKVEIRRAVPVDQSPQPTP